ncbi:MAG: hypothetical protein LBC61_06775 [Candidatus Peribacteria bacterium]|nr:hypothetical protein [Candidatus Peribacteria bacterium]
MKNHNDSKELSCNFIPFKSEIDIKSVFAHIVKAKNLAISLLLYFIIVFIG